MRKLLLVLPVLLFSTPLQVDITEQAKSYHNNSKSTAYYKIGKSYTKNGKRYRPHLDNTYSKTGIASYYGKGFHNRKTANGDIFDKNGLTAAHPTLPLFSRVKVTNLVTGKQLLVTVNDRGPFRKNRLIDLSEKSAKILDFKDTGVVKVKVEYDQAETERYLKERGLYEQYRKVTKG